MPKLILFDIDGTILRFKKSLSQSLVNYLVQNIFHSSINDSYLPDFSGKTDLMIIHEICNSSNIDFNNVLANINDIWSKLLEFFKPYTTKDNILVFPGVNNLITCLAKDINYQLGLVTGNFKENAYLKLSTVDLAHYFPFGAFGSDYEDRNLLPMLAVQRANEYLKTNIFNNENTIIIGDSVRDIECAKKNNMKVLCVATGPIDYEILKNHNPNAIIKDFKDYPIVLNLINNILN